MKIYQNSSGCHLSILSFPAAFNSAGANQEREEQTKKKRVKVDNSGVALSCYLQHSVVRSLAGVCSPAFLAGIFPILLWGPAGC